MRIQVLHLPCAENDHDFALVLDSAQGPLNSPTYGPDAVESMKRVTGAKCVLVFPFPVEVL